MAIFRKLLLLSCLILMNTDVVWGSSLPRYPEDDWKALSKLLKDKTIPITWKDSHGDSIVWFHMRYGSEETAVQYLKCATKQELALIDANGLLGSAAWHNSQRVTRTLLDRGISPNPKSPFLRSPLMSAASRENLEVMRMLIKAEADVKLRSEFDRDALDIALEEGKFNSVNLLLENGINLDTYKKQKNEGGLIFKAVHGTSTDVVNLLLQNRFNPNVFNELGETPLTYAIHQNAGLDIDAGLYIIWQLLNAGADECMRDTDGKLQSRPASPPTPTTPTAT